MVEGRQAKTKPLAGLTAWLITDGKAGMDVQVQGVADALGLITERKIVEIKGFWRHTAPWGPPHPSVRFGAPGSQFCPPWPAVAIATGRQSIPYIRALKRHAGLATYTIVLQDPRTGPKTADLIWVPEHDRRRGPNVITTLTAPHSFTQQRFAQLRAAASAEIAALPHPRTAVILGGNNSAYTFTNDDDDRLETALSAIASTGASFLVTPSRRTHGRLLRAVERATAAHPRLFWNGKGRNPYAEILAHADVLIVTADSTNMVGEACATGRPVYVFKPSGGSAKFNRFHDALVRYGATRPLPEMVVRLETWRYPPLAAAEHIASAVEVRWLRLNNMLRGAVSDRVQSAAGMA
jgi:mitochondrial fission protein ELM1